MEDIAAHSGLGMGTLYRHFPSKQALLTAMVGERFRGVAELAAPTCNRATRWRRLLAGVAVFFLVNSERWHRRRLSAAR